MSLCVSSLDMILQSTFEDDIRTPKTRPGAYEWWYFDALSADGKTGIVVIFYEGNPFSRRYINDQKRNNGSGANEFPAVSISVYKNDKPIYYSFTEFAGDKAIFKANRPYVQIGQHRMEGSAKNNEIIYNLKLQEKLPSDISIDGELRYKSPEYSKYLLNNHSQKDISHRWNLVQIRADVEGSVRCHFPKKQTIDITFKGNGYHDHNIGFEPMKKSFKEWYWGRFHFEDSTLIYYLLKKKLPKQYAWLIDNKSGEILSSFGSIKQKESSRNLFGLYSARKLLLKNKRTEVLIQQRKLLDNGPFYQRFCSDVFMKTGRQNRVETGSGFTEYLSPPRIYKRRFWPLTNMRIRYKKENPHWVQRSDKLYRLTW